jgi:glycosyltransferase involved in cell wall biosynthesis
MKQQALVTVIVPNYNHATFLQQRLDSIFNQTYQNFEVILLDDKSTDNSVEILREYAKNPKVSHFVENEENSGSTFKQWKKGLSLAKGEYIWIAESDDYAELNFLEEMIKPFEQNQKLALVYCRLYFVFFNTRDNKWEAFSFSNFGFDTDELFEGKDFIIKYLRFANAMPNASGILVKTKDLLNALDSQVMQMKYAGDWLCWNKICENNQIYFSNKKLSYFRNHPNTTRNITNYDKEIKRIEENLLVVKFANQMTKTKFNTWSGYDVFINDWVKMYGKFSFYEWLFPPYPIGFIVRIYLKTIQVRIVNRLWKKMIVSLGAKNRTYIKKVLSFFKINI